MQNMMTQAVNSEKITGIEVGLKLKSVKDGSATDVPVPGRARDCRGWAVIRTRALRGSRERSRTKINSSSVAMLSGRAKLSVLKTHVNGDRLTK